ncbi:TPA: tail fiber assembly protein [Kluyvera ascorbata]|uniref:tail fiber assembly protein n=1 Tax=Kluyvera ascorbata TaxID=51288 RepID=UPI00289E4C44|nr:tail fiber assembly protein [Kluyvera ascorbata]HED3065091.1 tail fiber assembly protein [Kluyvera ascorbata]
MSSSSRFAYSAANNLFYSYSREGVYRASGSWPDDVTDVSDDVFSEYAGVPPAGKQRIAGADGLPVWGDATLSVLSADQILERNTAERDRLLQACAIAAFPLQNRVDNGAATDKQAAQLEALKKYSVDLTDPNIVDLTSDPAVFPEMQ